MGITHIHVHPRDRPGDPTEIPQRARRPEVPLLSRGRLNLQERWEPRAKLIAIRDHGTQARVHGGEGEGN